MKQKTNLTTKMVTKRWKIVIIGALLMKLNVAERNESLFFLIIIYGQGVFFSALSTDDISFGALLNKKSVDGSIQRFRYKRHEVFCMRKIYV